MSEKVSHDRAARRFETVVDGHVAYLEYDELADGTLDYRSTFVPEALRGRGVASVVVEHALRHALSNGLRVVPSCPFVARYVERHPEFRAAVVD